MARESRPLLAFNRGILSRLGLSRVDLPRTALASEIMTNWVPRVLGSMMFRPGMGYIGNTNSDAKAKLLPFVFAFDDTALIEIVDGEMQVWVDDELIERPAVTAQTVNGSFTSNITSWTDNDEVGGASTWLTGGYAALLGDGTNAAILDQTVTVNEPGVEHALRIVVARGPIILRVGLSTTDDSLIGETTLGTGTHSLAFTANGNFNIRVMNRRSFTALIDSITVESAGAMQITTPWEEDDLSLIRTTQSGDVVYAACAGYQQRKIERRSERSWSVVLYEPETGPFRNVNVSPITMAPSGLTGDITIEASSPYFKSTNVGSLIRIQSSGQTVTESINAENTFSDEIRVTGVGNQRSFGITITGTFSATVTLQYSVAEPGNWIDVQSYTAVTSESYLDNLDNQVIYYRIGVKTGGFVSGPVTATLSFSSGSNLGVARITGFTDSENVSAVTLNDFGATTASADWWEGRWSDRRGWPSAVCIHESRIGMFGRDNIDLTISDQYEDYDDEVEGDSGPISRSIGEGPIETIPWALSLTRLIVGTLSSSANIEALKIQGSNPLSGRSSSLEEPLTPTNFNLKTTSPVGIFVDTSLTRLMELRFDVNENDYVPGDLSVATPDLNDAGIVGIAVQYKPDMRVHCWRADGTVGVMVRDRAENTICWYEVETDGAVEWVAVLPGAVEDRVYYAVRRTVDGDTVRFIEKVALESECRGGTLNKQADAFVTGTNSPPSATITGLDHLEGCEVVAWADGVDLSPGVDDAQTTYTVSGGQITVSTTVTNYIVGLAYEGRWKSGKQAFAAALGTALNVKGKIDHIGFVMLDTHAKGVRFGPDFEDEDGNSLLDDLPEIEDEDEVTENEIHTTYDKARLEFDGDWTTDPRVCLVANAPRPCTMSAVSVMLSKSG